jgi:hypothetical protein
LDLGLVLGLRFMSLPLPAEGPSSRPLLAPHVMR